VTSKTSIATASLPRSAIAGDYARVASARRRKRTSALIRYAGCLESHLSQQGDIGKAYARSAASLLAEPGGILTLAVGPRAGAIHGDAVPAERAGLSDLQTLMAAIAPLPGAAMTTENSTAREEVPSDMTFLRE
jgi:hypothetical protein